MACVTPKPLCHRVLLAPWKQHLFPPEEAVSVGQVPSRCGTKSSS